MGDRSSPQPPRQPQPPPHPPQQPQPPPYPPQGPGAYGASPYQQMPYAVPYGHYPTQPGYGVGPGRPPAVQQHHPYPPQAPTGMAPHQYQSWQGGPQHYPQPMPFHPVQAQPYPPQYAQAAPVIPQQQPHMSPPHPSMQQQQPTYGSPLRPTASSSLPPQEQAYYDALFGQAGGGASGVVSGKEAVQFMSRSGLPKPMLRQIWSLCDPSGVGTLDRWQFRTAMRLIAMGQAGVLDLQDPATLTRAQASDSMNLPLPRMDHQPMDATAASSTPPRPVTSPTLMAHTPPPPPPAVAEEEDDDFGEFESSAMPPPTDSQPQLAAGGAEAAQQPQMVVEDEEEFGDFTAPPPVPSVSPPPPPAPTQPPLPEAVISTPPRPPPGGVQALMQSSLIDFSSPGGPPSSPPIHTGMKTAPSPTKPSVLQPAPADMLSRMSAFDAIVEDHDFDDFQEAPPPPQQEPALTATPPRPVSAAPSSGSPAPPPTAVAATSSPPPLPGSPLLMGMSPLGAMPAPVPRSNPFEEILGMDSPTAAPTIRPTSPVAATLAQSNDDDDEWHGFQSSSTTPPPPPLPSQPCPPPVPVSLNPLSSLPPDLLPPTRPSPPRQPQPSPPTLPSPSLVDPFGELSHGSLPPSTIPPLPPLAPAPSAPHADDEWGDFADAGPPSTSGPPPTLAMAGHSLSLAESTFPLHKEDISLGATFAPAPFFHPSSSLSPSSSPRTSIKPTAAAAAPATDNRWAAFGEDEEEEEPAAVDGQGPGSSQQPLSPAKPQGGVDYANCSLETVKDSLLEAGLIEEAGQVAAYLETKGALESAQSEKERAKAEERFEDAMAVVKRIKDLEAKLLALDDQHAWRQALSHKRKAAATSSPCSLEDLKRRIERVDGDRAEAFGKVFITGQPTLAAQARTDLPAAVRRLRSARRCCAILEGVASSFAAYPDHWLRTVEAVEAKLAQGVALLKRVEAMDARVKEQVTAHPKVQAWLRCAFEMVRVARLILATASDGLLGLVLGEKDKVESRAAALESAARSLNLPVPPIPSIDDIRHAVSQDDTSGAGVSLDPRLICNLSLVPVSLAKALGAPVTHFSGAAFFAPCCNLWLNNVSLETPQPEAPDSAF